MANGLQVITFTVAVFAAIMLALAIVYYTMTAANAFGAVAAMVSSGLSAIAIGFLSIPKKPKKKVRCLLTMPLARCSLSLLLTLTCTCTCCCDET